MLDPEEGGPGRCDEQQRSPCGWSAVRWQVARNGGRKKVHMCRGEGVLSWEVVVNLGFTVSEVLLWMGSSVNLTPLLLYLPLLLGPETCKLHFPDALACWLPVSFCHWKVLAESEESSSPLPPPPLPMRMLAALPTWQLHEWQQQLGTLAQAARFQHWSFQRLRLQVHASIFPFLPA